MGGGGGGLLRGEPVFFWISFMGGEESVGEKRGEYEILGREPSCGLD